MTALCVINKQFRAFIGSKFTTEYDYDHDMTKQCFVGHTGCEIDTYREQLIQLVGSVMKFIQDYEQEDISQVTMIENIDVPDIISDTGNHSKPHREFSD